MRKRWTALAAGLAAATVLVSSGTAAARTSTAPVALSGWNLTLPVDSSGGTSGDATTLSPARLYSPYLTSTSTGALEFWAPSDGARLGISAHARTELRGTGTFTLGNGTARLTETATVTRVPDHSHDIIIGQMFPSGTTPFAMLHYQSGKVYGFIHGQSQEYVCATGIPLGAAFTDSITANGDTVTFSVTYQGKTTSKNASGIGSYLGDTMHFQAGDYQQDPTGQAASDGGRVTFSALSQSGVR
ncbi:MAG TPA: polysaccharide lyase family 7 protein [Pseudonocardiaceae bacterium]|nr:polysaccharide lyase family 7 protein [Pseudonocardiaceae bacterium]